MPKDYFPVPVWERRFSGKCEGAKFGKTFGDGIDFNIEVISCENVGVKVRVGNGKGRIREYCYACQKKIVDAGGKIWTFSKIPTANSSRPVLHVKNSADLSTLDAVSRDSQIVRVRPFCHTCEYLGKGNVPAFRVIRVFECEDSENDFRTFTCESHFRDEKNFMDQFAANLGGLVSTSKV